jgi:hypothetical protein
VFVVIVSQLVTQSIYARLKLASVGGLVHVMIAGASRCASVSASSSEDPAQADAVPARAPRRLPYRYRPGPQPLL